MTITEFLLARIAEDEAEADRELAEDDAPQAARWELLNPDYQRLMRKQRRECEAKRRIVEDLEWAERDYRTTRAEADEVRRLAALLAATRIASIYADHPDYHEEWRA